MLAKKNRLSRDEFNRFFSLGKKVHTPYFQLIHLATEPFKVSVVVSKKVAKTAVQRNKIRRRIYDIVRNHQKQYSITGVYIFLTKPPITTLPYATLKENVVSCVERTVRT